MVDNSDFHDVNLKEEENSQAAGPDVYPPLSYVIPEGCSVAPGPPPEDEIYVSLQPDYMKMELPPPPSYDSLVFKSSPVPLMYVDFMPRPLPGTNPPAYEDFSCVMAQANQWLSANPQYEAKTCENLERKARKDGVIETETTLHHESAYGNNAYIIGLRLWLALRDNSSEPPQQLGYFTVKPEFRVKKLAHTQMYQGFGGAHVESCYTLNLPSFDSFSRTVDKLNKQLQDNPIQGSILTVETMQYKYCESWQQYSIEPDKTYWSEKKDQPKLYVFLLRVFYVVGEPAHELIGLRDFKPECLTKNPSQMMGKPRFENFTSCIYKAGNWFYTQKGVKLTNIQQIDVMMFTGFGAVSFNPDKTEMVEFPRTGSSDKVRVIRAYFTIAPKPCPNPSVRLTTRLFAPVCLSGTRYENMSATMERIVAWLRATGAQVIGAQMVNMEVTPETCTIDPEKMTNCQYFGRGYYWLACVRLYLDGLYQEPPASMLPPVPQAALQGSSDCCTVL